MSSFEKSSNISQSFKEMKVSDYTDKSIAVQGDTRKYKEDLKKLGGKYNPQLKGGPGWIFPKTSEKDINSFITGGKRLVSEDEEKAGEKRTIERSKECIRSSETYIPDKIKDTIPRSFSHTSPTLGEFGILLTTINNMASKINKIDIAISFLLSDDQKKTLNTIINSSAQEYNMSKNNEKKSNFQVKEKVVKKTIKKESESDSGIDFDDEVIPVKRLLRK